MNGSKTSFILVFDKQYKWKKKVRFWVMPDYKEKIVRLKKNCTSCNF